MSAELGALDLAGPHDFIAVCRERCQFRGRMWNVGEMYFGVKEPPIFFEITQKPKEPLTVAKIQQMDQPRASAIDKAVLQSLVQQIGRIHYETLKATVGGAKAHKTMMAGNQRMFVKTGGMAILAILKEIELRGYPLLSPDEFCEILDKGE